MAIKKGAFDLYTAERQLPNKNSNKFSHKNPLFDDPQNTYANKNEAEQNSYANGSKTVHDRFTGSQVETHDKHSITDTDNTEIKSGNSSQTVHKRFTDTQIEALDEHSNTNTDNAEVKSGNSSQAVHKRFTDTQIEALDEHSVTNTNNTEIIPINGSQTIHEKTTPFSKLVGNQREIVLAIYKNIKINGNTESEELTLESIAELANVNIKSLKNTLFRLSSTGIIIRSDQKIGRGGWVKYTLPTIIYDEIKKIKITHRNK